MKKSPFLDPRAVIGFVLCSLGLLLALAGLSKSVTGTVATAATAATPGTWTATGSMSIGRNNFTATLLTNGKVLVAGRWDNSGSGFASAELYDPGTGTWMSTGSMTTRRFAHTATLLLDGKVLVAGGSNTDAISSAELYDPATGLWTLTGSMNTTRKNHIATLIPTGPLSGKVLVAGGCSTNFCENFSASAELYDPGTGTWMSTGSMTIARWWGNPASAILPDGSVLVVGGTTCCPYHWFNEAESYDPVSQTWTPTSTKMTHANWDPILLPDGKVLVAGGIKGTQPTSVNVADAELFDPSTGIWTATGSMSTDRAGHTLTLLTSGQVLVAGGSSGGWGVCNDLTSAELYDSSAGTWFPTGNMIAARGGHTATLLPNGQVLAAGGADCESNVLSSAELYTPPSANPVPLISQPLVPDATAPGGAGFTLTVNGTGFVSGSVVNWNDSARATTFVSNSQLTANILASDIATASTASVTVVNPGPGGGSSNVVFFPITQATSAISLNRSDVAVGAFPDSIVTADFNRDGRLDLADVNTDGSTVSVLLGNGDGTFQPDVEYPTETGGPIYLVVGDFNGDGNADFVTANNT